MKEVKRKLSAFTPGLTREITIWHFQPKHMDEKTPKIYLQASLHADEIPPMVVVDHLKKMLLTAESEGKLNAHFVVVPQANPIGGAQFLAGYHSGRFEQNSQSNFNREFFDFMPAIKKEIEGKLTNEADKNKKIIRQAMKSLLDKEEPLSELTNLRKTLMLESFDADVALDLHCDFTGLLHIYTGTQIFEEIKPLAQFMQSHAQMVADASGGNPYDEAITKTWWELRREFPNHPIPHGTIGATIELRGLADVSDELAHIDATNLYQYFIHAGFIAGTKPAVPKLIREATPLEGTDFIKVKNGGVLIYKKNIGDWIKKGEIIAEILNPQTSERSPVISIIDGQFLTRSEQRWCTAGAYIGKIVGNEAFRTGALLSAK